MFNVLYLSYTVINRKYFVIFQTCCFLNGIKPGDDGGE